MKRSYDNKSKKAKDRENKIEKEAKALEKEVLSTKRRSRSINESIVTNEDKSDEAYSNELKPTIFMVIIV